MRGQCRLEQARNTHDDMPSVLVSMPKRVLRVTAPCFHISEGMDIYTS